MTNAEKGHILLAMELRLKTEQFNVIAKTYDDEQAQTKSSSTGTKSYATGTT
jgi:hypothetical protein